MLDILGSTPINSCSILYARDALRAKQRVGARHGTVRYERPGMRLHQISAANTSRGVKRVDDRRVITGIFHVLRTGIPLAGLPAQYGPPPTICTRFDLWTCTGIRDRAMEAVADAQNGDMVRLDGPSVRAHPSATALVKRPASLPKKKPGRR